MPDNHPRHPECPTCGLPVYDPKIDAPCPELTCNPLRSPDCWSFIATLPKAKSVEAQVIEAARGEG